MKHSQRVAWFERAYSLIREEILPEAPADFTLTIGFPTKKRSGQALCVGECFYQVIKEHGEPGFAAENLITLHPILGEDIVNMMAVLVHEMIHHIFDPDDRVGHKKPFQVIAEKVGLCKPWTATTPDATLAQKLRSIALRIETELGYMPVGHFVPPPPPPKKPTAIKKFECGCGKPRVLNLSMKKLEEGPILCGICKQSFRLKELEGQRQNPNLDEHGRDDR